MKLSTLRAFLTDEVKSTELALALRDEVQRYRSQASTRGTSMPVIVDPDVAESLQIDRAAMTRIMDAYLTKQVDVWTLRYVCDALLLSDRINVMGRDLVDLLEACSDEQKSDQEMTELVSASRERSLGRG